MLIHLTLSTSVHFFATINNIIMPHMFASFEQTIAACYKIKWTLDQCTLKLMATKDCEQSNSCIDGLFLQQFFESHCMQFNEVGNQEHLSFGCYCNCILIHVHNPHIPIGCWIKSTSLHVRCVSEQFVFWVFFKYSRASQGIIEH